MKGMSRVRSGGMGLSGQRQSLPGSYTRCSIPNTSSPLSVFVLLY
jgi:hypothetical protein